jgi:predicted kinase
MPFDDTKLEVILMCALPGSGKDTYIRKHFMGYPVISLDEIRKELGVGHRQKKDTSKVVFVAKERAKNYLRQQQSFVWNATNLSKQLRSSLIDLFVMYKAKVTIVYIEVPYPQLLQQNRNREDVVPLKILERMIKRLEIPSLSEVHQIVYKIN